MEVKFTFPQTSIGLHIDLIDNPAVQSWAEHFLSQCQKANAYKTSPFFVWPYDGGLLVQEFLDILNDFVDTLGNLGYRFPSEMPRTSQEITRQWCNDLYRFSDDIQSPLAQEIKIFLSKIERYMSREREPADLIEINIDPSFPGNNITPWKPQPGWEKYFNDSHADVILSDPKLQKNTLWRYLVADMPGSSHINDHNHDGGICLQLGNQSRRTLYDRPDFQEWVGSTQPLFNLPIGNISNKTVIPEILREFARTERGHGPLSLVDVEILS